MRRLSILAAAAAVLASVGAMTAAGSPSASVSKIVYHSRLAKANNIRVE